jgi:phage baseplate assembly protein V
MLQFERSRHGVSGLAAADSERRHASAIDFGRVQEVDYAKARVRVLLGDEDDEDGHLVTGWLPMPGLRAQNDFDWHPLEVGERVVVLSASGEVQNGLVLPAGVYCGDNPAPGDKAGLWIRKFQDGGTITYDRDTGEWLVEGMAKATVKVGDSTAVVDADSITLTAGGVTLKVSSAGVEISGGSVTHDGVNIGKDHIHTQVAPGAGVSGPPQP